MEKKDLFFPLRLSPLQRQRWYRVAVPGLMGCPMAWDES